MVALAVVVLNIFDFYELFECIFLLLHELPLNLANTNMRETTRLYEDTLTHWYTHVQLYAHTHACTHSHLHSLTLARILHILTLARICIHAYTYNYKHTHIGIMHTRQYTRARIVSLLYALHFENRQRIIITEFLFYI